MKRVLFTFAIIVCFFTMSEAADYYVDAVNGSNATGNGTKATPWQSITYALQHVWGTVHTIHAAAGTYDNTLETFPISMKNHISLVGAGKDDTIIDAKQTDTVILCVNVTDNKTRIEGFDIRGGYAKIKSSNGWRGDGILIENSSLSVINNKIMSTYNSAIMVDRGSPTIQSNYIGNNVKSNASGIEIVNIGSSIIRYNTIQNYKDAGIHCYYNGSPYIEGNIIGNNVTGISCYGGISAIIAKNRILQNSTGLNFDDFTKIKVENNIIAKNQMWGMQVYDFTSGDDLGIFIINNTIDGNGVDGITFWGTDDIADTFLVKNNIISNNNGNGMQVYLSKVNWKSVEFNLFYNNAEGHYKTGSTNYTSVADMDASVPECRNNLEGNPKFLNTVKENYNLLSDSPAIDAGDPNSPLDPDGSPIDIGALSISPPAPPSNFSAIAGDFQVSLFWSPNFGFNLAYYVIYRSQTSGFIPSPGDSIAKIDKMDTTFVDLGVNNGITYYYRICAVDSIPELTIRKSEPSEEISVTPHSAPPAPPQNLQAIAGDSQVTLTWNPNTEVDMSHYIFYRSLTANFTPTKNDSIGQVNHPNANFLDSGLNNGTTYYYRITAVDVENVGSEPGDEVSAIPIGVHSILINLPNAEATVDSMPVGISGVFSAWGDYIVEVNGVKAEINEINFSAEIYLTNGTRQIIAHLLDSSNTILSSDTIQVSVLAPTPCIGMPGEYYGVYHETINGVKSWVKFEVDRYRTEIPIFEAVLQLINTNFMPPIVLFLDVSSENISIVNNSFPFQDNEGDLTYSFSGNFETKNKASGSYTANLDPFHGSWSWSVTNDTAKTKADVVIQNFPSQIEENNEIEYQVLVRSFSNTSLSVEYSAEVRLGNGIRIFDSNPKQIVLAPMANSVLNTKIHIPEGSTLGNASVTGVLSTSKEPMYVFRRNFVVTSVKDEGCIQTPTSFELCQNYPNPFNPETTIKYQLSEPSEVAIRIFNITGQMVKTMLEEHQPAGYQSILWDGRDDMGNHVSSGVYFYQLCARTAKLGQVYADTKKMVLVR